MEPDSRSSEDVLPSCSKNSMSSHLSFKESSKKIRRSSGARTPV